MHRFWGAAAARKCCGGVVCGCVVGQVFKVMAMCSGHVFVGWVGYGFRNHLVHVCEVLLHVRFPGGQCFLSKDCIACGRFFRSKLCRDLHVGDTRVRPLIIVKILRLCIMSALLMLWLGVSDRCFSGYVGSSMFGSVSL